MKKTHSLHSFYISRRFLLIFAVISIIFCFAMIPLMIYVNNIYADLQIKKIDQNLTSVSSEIKDSVTGIINISNNLSSDSRFIELKHAEAYTSAASVKTYSQLAHSFRGMIFPYDLISDAVLYKNAATVLTNKSVFLTDTTTYYPDFFYVGDLNSAEWEQCLASNINHFLPVYRIKSHGKEYDALIYVAKWMSDSYTYICINIADIKKLLVADSPQSSYYITFSTTAGEILYSDLPDNTKKYHTLSNIVSAGALKIELHVANEIFNQKMRPLYVFMTIYLSTYIVLLILTIHTGTRISTKPLIKILHILDRSKNLNNSNLHFFDYDSNKGINYICNSITNADMHLEGFQNLVRTQQSLLQARFLEKALNGQLMSSSDIDQFNSYFPDFPQSYRLVCLCLKTYDENGPVLYNEPLLLLQSFLQEMLPGAYLHQSSDMDLLLLISEKDFEGNRKTLDFLVDNINREEPSYVIRCISSKVHYHPDSLPIAYQQLQDMIAMSFSNERTHVCTFDDCTDTPRATFSIPNFAALYNAITNGEKELALRQLHAYSENVSQIPNPSLKVSVYEMFRSMLTCIKAEYPLLLIDEQIPIYNKINDAHEEISLYNKFSEQIERFCNKLNTNTEDKGNSFSKELIQYIELHYTDPDLCLTSLETHFKCSSSTLRKTFKNATGMTVASYIEKKRMNHANELLAQKQKIISEIALECGFTNVNTFYKAYKRVYGHAPTMQE